MFETSRDILNWAIAVSVVAVAISMVWAMAYVISMLRTVNELNRRIRGAVEGFTVVMAHLQDRIQSTAGYLPMIVQAVTRLVDYFMKQRAERRAAADDEQSETQPPRPKKKRM